MQISCHPFRRESWSGFWLVCFASWQYTSSRISSLLLKHVLITFSACPPSSFRLLRSPIYPVMFLKHCVAALSMSFVGIFFSAVRMFEFFHASILDTVVAEPKIPLRFRLKYASPYSVMVLVASEAASSSLSSVNFRIVSSGSVDATPSAPALPAARAAAASIFFFSASFAKERSLANFSAFSAPAEMLFRALALMCESARTHLCRTPTAIGLAPAGNGALPEGGCGFESVAGLPDDETAPCFSGGLGALGFVGLGGTASPFKTGLGCWGAGGLGGLGGETMGAGVSPTASTGSAATASEPSPCTWAVPSAP